MKINDKHVKLLYNAFDKYSARTKLNVSEQDIKDWAHVINVVNSMEEDEKLLSKYNVKDYEIPAEFSELVMPVRVSLTAAEGETDFLSHSHYREEIQVEDEETGEVTKVYQTISGEVISPTLFNEISDAMVITVNSNKVTDYAKKNLEDARKALTLTEAAKRSTTADGEYVTDEGWAHWPMRLNVVLYREEARFGNFLKQTDLSVEKFITDKVKSLKK